MVIAAEGAAQVSAALLATAPRHEAEAAEPSASAAELVAQGYGELVDSGRGINGKPRAQSYRATKEMSLC